MNAHLKLIVAAGALTLAAPEAIAKPMVASPQWAGTWILNLADSKFAKPGRRTEMRTYRVAGNQVRMESRGIGPDGKSINFRYAAVYDGKWYPMVGNPNADRIMLRVVSDREFRASSRLKGKPSVHSTATVSADGKHLMLKRKMLRMKGAPTDVLEFER